MEKQLGKPTVDIWDNLKKFTDARIALGRTGASLPTKKHLEFQLDHARARDSVNSRIDFSEIKLELNRMNLPFIELETKAKDKSVYLKRPDLGKELSIESNQILSEKKQKSKLVIILGDGLSAKAIQKQAIPFLKEFLSSLDSSISIFPIILVEGARVAVSDEIGEVMDAEIAMILIGERPGLSSPDSMGLYLTYNPKKERQDADRNCISNIREEGLKHKVAAEKANYLLRGALSKKISGVMLKDDMSSLNFLPEK
jgi:ethanolamine ammonia-lyase small subunit